jgi:hypothetical protein
MAGFRWVCKALCTLILVLSALAIIPNALQAPYLVVFTTRSHHEQSYIRPKDEFTIAVFTHSSFADVWPITAGQLHKNAPRFYKYWFSNDDASPTVMQQHVALFSKPNFELILYNGTLPLQGRTAWAVHQIQSKYFLFVLEDTISIGDVNTMTVETVLRIMKQNSLVHMKSFRAMESLNTTYVQIPTSYEDKSILKGYECFYVPHEAAYFLSIQPGIWATSAMQQLFESVVPEGNAWNGYEFHASQSWARSNFNHQFGFITNNLNNSIAADMRVSFFFPHVHAMRRGQWDPVHRDILSGMLTTYHYTGNRTFCPGDSC